MVYVRNSNDEWVVWKQEDSQSSLASQSSMMGVLTPPHTHNVESNKERHLMSLLASTSMYTYMCAFSPTQEHTCKEVHTHILYTTNK